MPGSLVIVEAKRDWLLPTEAQLASYAPRVHAHGGGVLVTLSQASDALARSRLPQEVGGVPVLHVAWRDVLGDLAGARGRARGSERLWLDQLTAYLKGIVRVRSIADCWTYCVVLSHHRPGGGGGQSNKEWVTERGTYFHLYGQKGWPTDPPNFMAFRWDGAVQQIRRVTAAEVVPSLSDRFPELPSTPELQHPHAVYRLGPALPPREPIPNGAQYRASRLWVLLDQLQSSSTLAEAFARSVELQRLN